MIAARLTLALLFGLVAIQQARAASVRLDFTLIER